MDWSTPLMPSLPGTNIRFKAVPVPQVHERCDNSSSTEAASRGFDKFKGAVPQRSRFFCSRARTPTRDSLRFRCWRWDCRKRHALTPIRGRFASGGNAEHRKSRQNGLPGAANADLDKLRAEVGHLIAVAEQD